MISPRKAAKLRRALELTRQKPCQARDDRAYNAGYVVYVAYVEILRRRSANKVRKWEEIRREYAQNRKISQNLAKKGPNQ